MGGGVDSLFILTWGVPLTIAWCIVLVVWEYWIRADKDGGNGS